MGENSKILQTIDVNLSNEITDKFTFELLPRSKISLLIPP